jgi:hypothetical protein
VAKKVVPEQYLTIAAIYPKWQRAIAAAQRAIAEVEAGAEDWKPIQRAKDRLYKLVDEAAALAPLSYKDPALDLLLAEIKALPSIDSATSRGRDARDKQRSAELKRLREEEREARRPYEWMRR